MGAVYYRDRNSSFNASVRQSRLKSAPTGFIAAAIFLAGCVAVRAADESTSVAKYEALIVRKSGMSEYDHVLVSGGFRLFYNADNGPLSPQNLSDQNRDGIPDYITSLLDKLQTARQILVAQLQLKDPLQEGRLHALGAQYIDIFIKDIPKQYGIASGVVSEREKKLFADSQFHGKSISLILHRNLIKSSATPIHELFHLFQFNYSEFYNRWFSEGLARWSQGMVTSKPLKEEPLPSTNAELEALLQKTHDAEFFWNRLAALCDRKSVANANIRPGTGLIKAVLENSEKQYRLIRAGDKAESSMLDYWPKKYTRQPANNVYLLKAIRDSLKACSQPQDRELAAFIELLPK